MFRRSCRHLHCRDTTHTVHRLQVTVHADHRWPGHVILGVDDIALLLTPLQVGWLRGQLRAAVIAASTCQLADHREVTR